MTRLMEIDDEMLAFWIAMEESKSYIKMNDLRNGFCYKIWARNAYVGVWNAEIKSFMISRYKSSRNPRLFYESHWDIISDNCLYFGTVKPIEIIEEFPFELKENYSKPEEIRILDYLDDLEQAHPIIQGVDTLKNRRQSAINYELRRSFQLKGRAK